MSEDDEQPEPDSSAAGGARIYQFPTRKFEATIYLSDLPIRVTVSAGEDMWAALTASGIDTIREFVRELDEDDVHFDSDQPRCRATLTFGPMTVSCEVDRSHWRTDLGHTAAHWIVKWISGLEHSDVSINWDLYDPPSLW